MLDAMTGKSSPRDFISTTLLKDCSGVFASVTARLVNLSFSEGLFQIQFKTEQVTPIFKKTDLDPSNPASYRPISNLNTISKILERLFLVRLIPHVSPSICPLQSAYRQFHSTETVVLKITSDLFEADEFGCVTVLVALDLSAAFDTIDHLVLLRRLEHTFGDKGPALSWAKSYLEERSCFVKVGNAMPTTLISDIGVSQGSVLGPLLFSVLTTHSAMSYQVSAHKFHQYADETQIYLAANKNSLSKATLDLADCTDAVYEWLLHNSLALNPDKSEVNMFGIAQIT